MTVRIAVDIGGGGVGRGAHVHAAPSCLERACRAGFARSFRTRVRATAGELAEQIIAAVEAAEAGTSWALGTELNLVRRLALAHPDKQVAFLDRAVCYCSTMNRIDLPHLVWALEHLVEGQVVNRITVDVDTAHWARVALERMLALPGTPAAPASHD